MKVGDLVIIKGTSPENPQNRGIVVEVREPTIHMPAELIVVVFGGGKGRQTCYTRSLEIFSAKL